MNASIIGFLFLIFFQSTLADLNISIIIEEVVDFCKNNGHKYVTFVDENDISDSQKEFLISLEFNGKLRSRIVDIKDLFPNTGNMDTLVFLQVENKDNIDSTLESIHQHKRQKSVVVMNQQQFEEFTKTMVFPKNSYFYLLRFHSPIDFDWYTVMTFYNSSEMIINKIHFDQNGLAIEDYNMQGYEIVATSLDWQPFIAHKNCNENGRKCQNFGLLVDQMNIWATNFNFTWDIMAGYGNDWGLFPKSGPYNASGNWTGVMGDVVAGRYPMSLNSWNWVVERNQFLDFVPVVKDNEILALIPLPPEVDPGLFIRPFRDEVWKGIGYLILFGTFMLVVPYMFINGYDNMTSSKISITSLWFFFVLVNAYYGGALTMFFVSEITLPFKTIRDVLQVFPSWNLVYLDGNDNYFKLPASQGDPDFGKYWNEVETNKEKYVASGIWEGFEELKKGQTVLHALSAILRGANKADPSSVPPIKTFGAKKSTYFTMLFTENSPLVPLFTKAVTKTFETGQYDRIAVKWQGADIKSLGAVDLMILSPGQVFLIFGVLMALLTCSIICLALECIYFYGWKKKMLLWKSFREVDKKEYTVNKKEENDNS